MSERGLAVSLASSFYGHYAHCGFLCELEKAGVIPARVAGASAGALAGGLWAGGLRGDALKREILSFGFRRSFFDYSAIWRLWGVMSWSYSPGIFTAGRMARRLKSLLGDRRIEEIDSPRLELAVANLCRGVGELRNEGNLVEFMLASISMPLVFCPRRIGGERFLDGGVSNETPYAHWLDDPDVDEIIVHRIVQEDNRVGKGFISPGKVISAIHAIPNAELEEYRRQHARRSGKRVVVLETTQRHPGLLQSRRTGEVLVEAGAATARRWLESRG